MATGDEITWKYPSIDCRDFDDKWKEVVLLDHSRAAY